ncbi:MAG: succinyl-diaminopimelate desuccinylase [Actinomycetota bacterium]|nr:succinyl-diaminopimelate desuccinylase [Actinomycetota bacterium]
MTAPVPPTSGAAATASSPAKSPASPAKSPASPAKSPAADLVQATAALVSIPSVSRQESAIAALVAGELSGHPWLEVTQVGDNVIARTVLGREKRLLVAGHLDTVPPAGNDTARIEDEAVWGVGACDMKGGVAVILDLAATCEEPTVDVTWCLYAREELTRAENGLVELWASRPDLLEADAAVLCEPTDARVEAGCQGTLRAEIRLGGVRAHTARPFAGRNAIHRLGPLLERLSSYEGRTVELDGCAYVEQLQAVFVSGGVAGNVVPDEAVLTVNHRFAPDRDLATAAEATTRALTDGLLDEALGDRVVLVDGADGAPPELGHPLLAALVERSGYPPRAKLGWTDVATMWAHGIPATNFGPGDPLLAHHPDEHVRRASLQRVREALGALVTGNW